MNMKSNSMNQKALQQQEEVLMRMTATSLAAVAPKQGPLVPIQVMNPLRIVAWGDQILTLTMISVI